MRTNTLKSKKRKKITWIQYGENRLQKQLVNVTNENKRLRCLLYQAYPNLLRKLPKELMKLVISFLDQRLLDCIIVYPQFDRYVIHRNFETRDDGYYFDIFKGFQKIRLLKKRCSISQVLCAFENMKWKWYSGRDQFLPRPQYRANQSLTRNDLLVLGHKRCEPPIERRKLIGPCKLEFLKYHDKNNIEMCLGLNFKSEQ